MTSEDCLRVWKDTEEEIENITDIYEFLSEDVLEITRDQYQGYNGEWTTKSYTLVLGTGGPHTEIDTNCIISVFWWSDECVSKSFSSKVESVMSEIEEYLNEIYQE